MALVHTWTVRNHFFPLMETHRSENNHSYCICLGKHANKEENRKKEGERNKYRKGCPNQHMIKKRLCFKQI